MTEPTEQTKPNQEAGESPAEMPLRRTKITLGAAAMALGLATIVSTIAHGGGIRATGVLFGAILAAMAGLRLYLTLRHNT